MLVSCHYKSYVLYISEKTSHLRLVITLIYTNQSYKIAVLTFKILTTHQPTASMLVCLHCILSQHLHILYMNTEFGRHPFSYYSSKIWNEIPVINKASDTVATSKRQLKCHFLSQLATHWHSPSLSTWWLPAPPVQDFLTLCAPYGLWGSNAPWFSCVNFGAV